MDAVNRIPAAGEPVPQVSQASQISQVSGAKRVDSALSESASRPDEKSAGIKGEDIRKAVEDLNSLAKMLDNKFKVSVHEETQRYELKVIDTETEKVIRTIPPEEILDLVARFKDMAGVVLTGLFLDKHV